MTVSSTARLLTDVLRGQWNRPDAYITTDCVRILTPAASLPPHFNSRGLRGDHGVDLVPNTCERSVYHFVSASLTAGTSSSETTHLSATVPAQGVMSNNMGPPLNLKTKEESCAAAINAGTDLEMGKRLPSRNCHRATSKLLAGLRTCAERRRVAAAMPPQSSTLVGRCVVAVVSCARGGTHCVCMGRQS